MSQKQLKRSSSDKVLAGVCGGIAEYLGINSLIVRLLFIFSGIGFIAYIIIALLIPSDY